MVGLAARDLVICCLKTFRLLRFLKIALKPVGVVTEVNKLGLTSLSQASDRR